MMKWLKSQAVAMRAGTPEDGQGLVEYAMIISFVAVAVVGTLTAFGQAIVAMPSWTFLGNL